MIAVLILAGSKAMTFSASASVLALGVVLAAVVSAIGQWIASAKSRWATVLRLVIALASTVGVLVPILYDCGWWAWLCDAMI